MANQNPTWLRTALWTIVTALVLIGITGAALRTSVVAGFLDYLALGDRVSVWTQKMRPPEQVRADTRFVEGRYAQHPLLMLAHVVPAFLFLLLGPWQFMARIRSRYLRLHRWSGRLFLLSGLWIGISALTMPFRFPLISGGAEVVWTLSFGTYFLLALGKAYLHIRRRAIALHREWMIRAFAIGLGIAAARPIDIAFFVFTPMPSRLHFGIALWISLVSLSLAAEAWIRYTRPFTEAASQQLQAPNLSG